MRRKRWNLKHGYKDSRGDEINSKSPGALKLRKLSDSIIRLLCTKEWTGSRRGGGEKSTMGLLEMSLPYLQVF